ncbi:MAG: hypothetical protein KKE86_06540 [Planctomycetes bacterium]|nr:hypothetical protein [Planctomycetota bacterium]MBU4398980.1 hypothetical protein [Planctomycetota bacterium]MCG2685192.1 hypothetical protein [Planctomycetales bacterium]
MRKVFADTLYWIATVKPNDPYEAAVQVVGVHHELEYRFPFKKRPEGE